MVDQDRQRLLAVERLILETICFNFTSRMPFPYVIKIGRAFGGASLCIFISYFDNISLFSDKEIDKIGLAFGH
jgi:CTD kinase subunit beta